MKSRAKILLLVVSFIVAISICVFVSCAKNEAKNETADTITLHYIVNGEEVQTQKYKKSEVITEFWLYSSSNNFMGWYNDPDIKQNSLPVEKPSLVSVVENNQYVYGATYKGTKGFVFDYDKGNDSYIIKDFKTDVPDSVTSLEVPGEFNGKPCVVDDVGTNGIYSGVSVFEKFVSLTNIDIGWGMLKIESGAFKNCMSLETVTIPDSVVAIGSSAFKNCGKLKSITIPNSVTSLGSGAFEHCASLENVKFGDGIVVIEADTFYGCKTLRSIDLPKNLTEIKEYAFSNCSSLESMILGNTLTIIGSGAFSKCNSLETVYFGNAIQEIGLSAFEQCKFATVQIPKSVEKIGMRAFSCNVLQVVYCEAFVKPAGWDSNWIRSNVPVIWNCSTNTKDENGNAYIFKDKITYSINNGEAKVFKASLDISGHVEIPNSIEYLGESFSVTEIGKEAFYYDGVNINITSISLPKTITRINDHAFYCCDSLTKVEFTKNVSYIGVSAFSLCKQLSIIDYDGTKEDWKGITKKSMWAYTTHKSLYIQCTDGQIMKSEA